MTTPPPIEPRPTVSPARPRGRTWSMVIVLLALVALALILVL